MTDETQEIQEANLDPTQVDTQELATEVVADARPEVKIKPTVGRMVWYWPATELVNALGLVRKDDQPFPAQIVHVTDDYTVNLSVLDHTAKQFAALDVYLKPDGSEATAPHASWMTYQLANA